MTRECYVAFDFDGTCVTHDYPNVGKDIGADVWLRAAVALGGKLILHTMRSGEYLQRALDWCDSHNVELWSVNGNPTQADWTDSPKLYANIYVDDAGILMPLKSDKHGARSYLDWRIVGPALLTKIAGILNQ